MARRGPITVVVKELLIRIDLEPGFANNRDAFRNVVLNVVNTVDLYNLNVGISRGGFIGVNSRGSASFNAA